TRTKWWSTSAVSRFASRSTLVGWGQRDSVLGRFGFEKQADQFEVHLLLERSRQLEVTGALREGLGPPLGGLDGPVVPPEVMPGAEGHREPRVPPSGGIAPRLDMRPLE